MSLYSDRPYQIAPAAVPQSRPLPGAQEMEVNAEQLTQRVIACIVFTKKG
jgi:hypothetical protein